MSKEGEYKYSLQMKSHQTKGQLTDLYSSLQNLSSQEEVSPVERQPLLREREDLQMTRRNQRSSLRRINQQERQGQ